MIRTDIVIIFALIILIDWSCKIYASDTYCPIGFQGFNRLPNITICYKLKGPEKFEDKYRDCSGNKYSMEFIKMMEKHSDEFRGLSHKLWTDHKTLYPEGIFVDWSYTKSTGDINPELSEYSDIEKRFSKVELAQDLCKVWDVKQKDTFVDSCEEKYYRYCVVSAYRSLEQKACQKEYSNFDSPISTCISVIRGVGGGAVRATWSQAQNMCHEHGGIMLQRGWRYANHPSLHKLLKGNKRIPLGIEMAYDEELYWTEPGSSSAKIPNEEWNFGHETFSLDTSLLALKDDTWLLVNDSSIFYNVACEKPRDVPDIELRISQTKSGDLVLKTPSDSSSYVQPICFTDSFIPLHVDKRYSNIRINIKIRSSINGYTLIPEGDGYYWCVNAHSLNSDVAETNKYLYIKNKDKVKNRYAIKFLAEDKYNIKKLDKLLPHWMRTLGRMCLCKGLFKAGFENCDIEKPTDLEFDEIFKNSKIKRIYGDKRTVLIHTELHEEILRPSNLSCDPRMLFMRPVYYCIFEEDLVLGLGESIHVDDCKTYTCVGDFNEGVQVLVNRTPNCKMKASTSVPMTATIALDDSAENPLTTPLEIKETTTEATSTNAPTTNIYRVATEPVTAAVTTTVNVPRETVITVTLPSGITNATETEPVTESTPCTSRPPQEQVNVVLNTLEGLLTQEVIDVNSIEVAFDEVDDLLSTTDDVSIPGEFLTMLDEVGTRADLNGSRRVTTVRGQVAMMVADAHIDYPVRGLRIVTGVEQFFTDGSFEILSGTRNETHLETDSSEAVIFLPESVAVSNRRVSFVVFRNDRPFLPAEGYTHYNVNSRIISIKIQNVTEFDNGEVIDIHLKPIEGILSRNQSRSCGYWHFLENGTGKWSQDGCIFIAASTRGLLDTCRCTHLTHFAEVLVPKTVFSEKNEMALEILSVIGCGVSMVGLAIIGLTAIMFRTWRRDFNNKIWLNLCIAILILIISFLIVSLADFQNYNLLCMFTGIALHYAVVCSFSWMLVAAIISYRRLVLVFTRDASHKLFRACAFAYGVPFAILGILLSVDPHAYAGRFEEKTPSGTFCYPSGLALWLTVYVPVAAMLLANCALFVIIVRSVFATKNIQRHGDTKDAVRCASVSCLLVFLFGLPWVFGLFAYLLVFAYLFTLTATFQGFVLFMFFVIGNKKTRELWMNKLKIKQTRKVIVTSSSSNRGEETVTIEADLSKPRSLTATDDSRFS